MHVPLSLVVCGGHQKGERLSALPQGHTDHARGGRAGGAGLRQSADFAHRRRRLQSGDCADHRGQLASLSGDLRGAHPEPAIPAGPAARRRRFRSLRSDDDARDHRSHPVPGRHGGLAAGLCVDRKAGGCERTGRERGRLDRPVRSARYLARPAWRSRPGLCALHDRQCEGDRAGRKAGGVRGGRQALGAGVICLPGQMPRLAAQGVLRAGRDSARTR